MYVCVLRLHCVKTMGLFGIFEAGLYEVLKPNQYVLLIVDVIQRPQFEEADR